MTYALVALYLLLAVVVFGFLCESERRDGTSDYKFCAAMSAIWPAFLALVLGVWLFDRLGADRDGTPKAPLHEVERGRVVKALRLMDGLLSEGKPNLAQSQLRVLLASLTGHVQPRKPDAPR